MSTAISNRHRKPDKTANEFPFSVSSILSQKSSSKKSSFTGKMAKSSSSGASSNQSTSSSKKNKFAGSNMRAPSAANAVMEDARPYTQDNIYNKLAASSNRRMGNSSSVMNQSFTSTTSRPQSNNQVAEVLNNFPEMNVTNISNSRTYSDHNRDSNSESAQQRLIDFTGYRESRGSTGSSPLDRSMTSKPEGDSPIRKETREPKIFQMLNNFMRKTVSKKKNRHTFEQDRDAGDTSVTFDLTYVEQRIVAMGYPSKGFEGFYRNALDQVEKRLNKEHGTNYKVYNLCAEAGRKDGYEDHRFNGNVCNGFGFYDHNPPTFEIMQGFLEDAYEYLCADDKNTIVVHCKAGKGRTGTVISALFIYISYMHEKFRKEQEASSPNEIMTDSTNSKNTINPYEKPRKTPIIPEFKDILMAEYAMEYYGSVRTSNGKGVTIPSQKRFVKYVELYYKYSNNIPVYKIKPSRLLKISLINLPKIYKNNLFAEVYIWSRREKKAKKLRQLSGWSFPNLKDRPMAEENDQSITAAGIEKLKNTFQKKPLDSHREVEHMLQQGVDIEGLVRIDFKDKDNEKVLFSISFDTFFQTLHHEITGQIPLKRIDAIQQPETRQLSRSEQIEKNIRSAPGWEDTPRGKYEAQQKREREKLKEREAISSAEQNSMESTLQSKHGVQIEELNASGLQTAQKPRRSPETPPSGGQYAQNIGNSVGNNLSNNQSNNQYNSGNNNQLDIEHRRNNQCNQQFSNGGGGGGNYPPQGYHNNGVTSTFHANDNVFTSISQTLDSTQGLTSQSTNAAYHQNKIQRVSANNNNSAENHHLHHHIQPNSSNNQYTDQSSNQHIQHQFNKQSQIHQQQQTQQHQQIQHQQQQPPSPSCGMSNSSINGVSPQAGSSGLDCSDDSKVGIERLQFSVDMIPSKRKDDRNYSGASSTNQVKARERSANPSPVSNVGSSASADLAQEQANAMMHPMPPPPYNYGNYQPPSAQLPHSMLLTSANTNNSAFSKPHSSKASSPMGNTNSNHNLIVQNNTVQNNVQVQDECYKEGVREVEADSLSAAFMSNSSNQHNTQTITTRTSLPFVQASLSNLPNQNQQASFQVTRTASIQSSNSSCFQPPSTSTPAAGSVKNTPGHLNLEAQIHGQYFGKTSQNPTQAPVFNFDDPQAIVANVQTNNYHASKHLDFKTDKSIPISTVNHIPINNQVTTHIVSHIASSVTESSTGSSTSTIQASTKSQHSLVPQSIHNIATPSSQHGAQHVSQQGSQHGAQYGSHHYPSAPMSQHASSSSLTHGDSALIEDDTESHNNRDTRIQERETSWSRPFGHTESYATFRRDEIDGFSKDKNMKSQFSDKFRVVVYMQDRMSDVQQQQTRFEQSYKELSRQRHSGNSNVSKARENSEELPVARINGRNSKVYAEDRSARYPTGGMYLPNHPGALFTAMDTSDD